MVISIAWEILKSIISHISPKAWLVLGILAAVIASYAYVYHKGVVATEDKYIAEQQRLAQAWAAEYQKKQTVVTKVVDHYITKMVQQKDTGSKILQEVHDDKDITNFPTPLPLSMRRIFNEAASNSGTTP